MKHLLLAFAIVLAYLSVGVPGASAQAPQPQFVVMQQYSAGTVRTDGAMVYTFIAMSFESERDASESYELLADNYLDFFTAGAEADSSTVEDTGEVKRVPKYGEERTASTFLTTDGELEFEGTVLIARDGKVLHMWFSLGVVDSTDELFEIADETMEFGTVRTERQLTAMLPDENDLPAGFSLITSETL